MGALSGVAVLVGKITVAVVAAADAAGLALHGAGLWHPPRELLVAAIASSAVLAAGSTSLSAVAEWRARRMGARREALDVLLQATAWAIVDLAAVDYRDIGVAAYLVARPWSRPWRPVLRRIHRVRARRRPVTSAVKWRPGVGVIGACVAQGQIVAQDLSADYAAIWPCSKREWDHVVPESIRHGLSYAEFLDVREKYEVVVATPILDDSKARTAVKGCVALDGPAGTLPRLTQPDVLGMLDSAAQGLLRQSVAVP